MGRVVLHHRRKKTTERDQHGYEKLPLPEKTKANVQSCAPRRRVITLWSLGMTCLAMLYVLPEDRNAATAVILCVIPLIGLLLTVAIRTLHSTAACMALAISVNVLLLFFVRSCKELSQFTGRPIDVDAFRIVLAPSDVILGSLGESAVNKFQAVMLEEAIWSVIDVCSTLFFAYLLRGSLSRIPTNLVDNFTRIFLLGLKGFIAICLLTESVHFWKDELRIHPSRHSTLQGATACAGIPPLHIKDNKNVVFVVMESLRADFFNRETFEETFAVLDDLRSGDGSSATCTEWKNHDSESMQSDYAHSGLLHGFTPSRSEYLRQFARNPNIQSWPLNVFRNNGYEVQRVSQAPTYGHKTYEYCFSIHAWCDLYDREFQTGIDYHNDMAAVFNKSLELLKSASHHKKNLFLVTDIQHVHNPYNSSVAKFHPTCSESEMWELYHNRWHVSPSEFEDIRRRIQNRYANAVAETDKYMATFLRELMPNLGSDTLLAFVGDHGEFLLDDADRSLGHAVNTFEDTQRHVPMMWCGESSQVAGLELSNSHVSTHVDIMPTLLEALGVDFDDTWRSQMPGQSYYNHLPPPQPTGALDGGFAMFTGPNDGKRVARTSKLRIEMNGDDFNSVGIGGYNASVSEIKQVLEKISVRSSQDWPGWMCNDYEAGDSVSCGQYIAGSCMECPQGFGPAKCHGDCRWDRKNNQCVLRSTRGLKRR
uniref:Sulfatase N-terminal domain-containing protein n=1 Tax=Odontella aurita TaxID=265563 RepID=A0A7S4JUL4_9STRA|mmetsp:Transcript_53877/g.161195  ORF Transcript_53877/g.161195 Transcript_53877/m.161195 type:complete len:707 (+) Transcript_53877:231-2351(+)